MLCSELGGYQRRLRARARNVKAETGLKSAKTNVPTNSMGCRPHDEKIAVSTWPSKRFAVLSENGGGAADERIDDSLFDTLRRKTRGLLLLNFARFL